MCISQKILHYTYIYSKTSSPAPYSQPCSILTERIQALAPAQGFCEVPEPNLAPTLCYGILHLLGALKASEKFFVQARNLKKGGLNS